ncbi:hypothetical protein IC582_024093 [Cucumis melo]
MEHITAVEETLTETEMLRMNTLRGSSARVASTWATINDYKVSDGDNRICGRGFDGGGDATVEQRRKVAADLRRLGFVKVMVWRGADRRGVRRVREGHMDASSFFMLPLTYLLLSISFEY